MTTPGAPAHTAASLLVQHGVALRAYFRRATGDGDVADDLVQEVFVRVMQALPAYEPLGRERAWLFAIAHNVLVDRWRGGQRAVLGHAAVTPALSEPARQDVRVAIDQALSRLPDEDRQVFLLAEIAGLTYDEIAELRATTRAAVRSRLFRARLALRAALAPPAPLPSARRKGDPHDD